MDNLASLKTALLSSECPDEAIEKCYADFLNQYDYTLSTILYGLLQMAEPTPRINEILKVFDLIRFPVKKPFAEVFLEQYHQA